MVRTLKKIHLIYSMIFICDSSNKRIPDTKSIITFFSIASIIYKNDIHHFYQFNTCTGPFDFTLSLKSNTFFFFFQISFFSCIIVSSILIISHILLALVLLNFFLLVHLFSREIFWWSIFWHILIDHRLGFLLLLYETFFKIFFRTLLFSSFCTKSNTHKCYIKKWSTQMFY